MNHIKRLLCLSLVLFALVPVMQAEDFSAKEVVLEHIKDSHDWHVTDLGEGKSLVIPLPVIVNSSTGWHVLGVRASCRRQRTAPGSLRTGHRHRG